MTIRISKAKINDKIKETKCAECLWFLSTELSIPQSAADSHQYVAKGDAPLSLAISHCCGVELKHCFSFH